MNFGIAYNLAHSSPEDWAKKHFELGCRAVSFPYIPDITDEQIKAYKNAADKYGLIIAEVGAWSNPISPDKKVREDALCFCKKQLALADKVGARCCVNIAGSMGEVWSGAYPENYSEECRKLVIESVREIIDDVKPKNTYYALELMPWMIPDSPEDYAKLIEEVGRERFAVHLDCINLINSPKRYFFNAETTKKCFELLGDKVKSCHLKDIRYIPASGWQLEECPVGDGNFDYITYAKCINETNPDICLLIEHLPTEQDYIDRFGKINDEFKSLGII